MRYPRDKILQIANTAIQESDGQAVIYFKAECPHCHTDCAVDEPNTWYDELECCRCKKTFRVTLAGFMLVLNRSPKPDA